MTYVSEIEQLRRETVRLREELAAIRQQNAKIPRIPLVSVYPEVLARLTDEAKLLRAENERLRELALYLKTHYEAGDWERPLVQEDTRRLLREVVGEC